MGPRLRAVMAVSAATAAALPTQARDLAQMQSLLAKLAERVEVLEKRNVHTEKVLGAGARSFVVLPPLPPGEHESVDESNPATGVLVIHAR